MLGDKHAGVVMVSVDKGCHFCASSVLFMLLLCGLMQIRADNPHKADTLIAKELALSFAEGSVSYSRLIVSLISQAFPAQPTPNEQADHRSSGWVGVC